MNESSGYQVVSSFELSDSALDPTIRKIRSFSFLESGWAHGEGIPISSEVILVAESLRTCGLSLGSEANAFPGLHGDVAVAFYKRDRRLELVIQPSLKIDIHVEEGEGFRFLKISEQEQVQLETAYQHLNDFIGEKKWISRASLIPNILISMSDDSRTLPLSIQQGDEMILPTEEQEYQFSKANVRVLGATETAFVGTSQDTTPASTPNPVSSGLSISQS